MPKEYLKVIYDTVTSEVLWVRSSGEADSERSGNKSSLVIGEMDIQSPGQIEAAGLTALGVLVMAGRLTTEDALLIEQKTGLKIRARKVDLLAKVG